MTRRAAAAPPLRDCARIRARGGACRSRVRDRPPVRHRLDGAEGRPGPDRDANRNRRSGSPFRSRDRARTSSPGRRRSSLRPRRRPTGPVYMLLGAGQGRRRLPVPLVLGQAEPEAARSRAAAAGSASSSHARTFGYALRIRRRLAGPSVHLIEGYAPGAVRMRIGNRFYKTPYGWFIAVYRGHELLTAYGVHGGIVARVRLRRRSEERARASAGETRRAGRADQARSCRHLDAHRLGQDRHPVTPTGRTFRWIHTTSPVQVSVDAEQQGRSLHLRPRRLENDADARLRVPR